MKKDNLAAKKEKVFRWMIRGILILLSLGMLIWGIARKEPKEVKNKGSLICLECTGLE